VEVVASSVVVVAVVVSELEPQAAMLRTMVPASSRDTSLFMWGHPFTVLKKIAMKHLSQGFMVDGRRIGCP
jgi:hypothetical protein